MQFQVRFGCNMYSGIVSVHAHQNAFWHLCIELSAQKNKHFAFPTK